MFKAFINILIFCISIFLTGCAVNTLGFGIEKKIYVDEFTYIEHNNGTGILFDTRYPTFGLLFGHLDQYVICPKSETNNDVISIIDILTVITPLIYSTQKTNHSTRPELCHSAHTIIQKHTGLGLFTQDKGIRLTIGVRQSAIMHIKDGMSVMTDINYEHDILKNGKMFLLTEKEIK
jgi:hypothetical protein